MVEILLKFFKEWSGIKKFKILWVKKVGKYFFYFLGFLVLKWFILFYGEVLIILWYVILLDIF